MTAFCNRVIDKALANNKLLVTSYSYKSIGSVMENEKKYYPYSASFAFTPVGFSVEKYSRLKFNLVLYKTVWCKNFILGKNSKMLFTNISFQIEIYLSDVECISRFDHRI